METTFEPFERPHRTIRKRPSGTALKKAMDLLAKCGYSEAGLRGRLIACGFTAEEAEQAASECRARHFLDDRLLAADVTGAMLSRGSGTSAIRHKLRILGVTEEETCNALANVTEEAEYEAAKRAFEGKLSLLSGESDLRKKREKLLRFMASRGFPPALAYRLWDECAMNEREDFR